MKHVMAVTALLVWLMVGYAPLQAQNCFRGQPLPQCKSFWITEFGWGLRVGEGLGGSYFTSEVGKMFNRKRNYLYALGATVLLGYNLNDDAFRLGIKPRFRRWINPTLSIDLSAGVILWGSSQQGGKNPVLTGHLGLNFKDLFILCSQLEAPDNSEKKALSWYVGLKTGSKPGLISHGLAVIAVGVLVVLFLSMPAD